MTDVKKYSLVIDNKDGETNALLTDLSEPEARKAYNGWKVTLRKFPSWNLRILDAEGQKVEIGRAQ